MDGCKKLARIRTICQREECAVSVARGQYYLKNIFAKKMEKKLAISALCNYELLLIDPNM
jgi:hypothetical protein